MSYDEMRHFADSWGLVFMGVSFIVLVGWAFRRGARADQERAARSILEEVDG
ncbi:MAG: cbb3-type cytochrome c oxidase subunit 3 [Rhizobiaceae bacterium]|nr:MAG: cbb3-type cytochrome c oxidase subunit 3 [Rhizobiaceae bacterium]